MKLTKEQAIKNHRKMWNWIADKTKKSGRKVTKEYYFRKKRKQNALYDDYCCEFTQQFACIGGTPPWSCALCPIDWGSESDCPCIQLAYKDNNGLFTRWLYSRSAVTSAQLAREIANLPEKPNSEIIRAAFKEAENYPDVDELDFYTTLTDSGFTIKDIRESMGDEAADHMQQFCKEHGLV